MNPYHYNKVNKQCLEKYLNDYEGNTIDYSRPSTGNIRKTPMNERKIVRPNSAARVDHKYFKEEMTKDYSNYSRPQSRNGSRIDNQSKISNSRSNISSAAHAQYLDRRHFQTLEKINKMRIEKIKSETSELRFTPQISENSKKIVERLTNDNTHLNNRLVALTRNNSQKLGLKMKTNVILGGNANTIEPKYINRNENQHILSNKQHERLLNPKKQTEILKRPNSAHHRTLEHKPVGHHMPKSHYTPYDNKKIDDTRNKLHHLYQGKLESKTIITKPERRNILNYTEKFQPVVLKNNYEQQNTKQVKNYQAPAIKKKISSLPEDNKIDVQVDFNELDQFSPPYTGPMNIKFDSNPTYQHNTPSTAYGYMNAKKNSSTIDNTQLRCKDIQKLNDFVDRLNVKKDFYTIDPSYNSKISNYKYSQQISNQFNIHNKANTFNDRDQYKLDNSSKNFAMERLKQIQYTKF